MSFSPNNMTTLDAFGIAEEMSEKGEPRPFMALTLQNGLLDQVAPLNEETGCWMRIDMCKELAIAGLLLSSIGTWDNEEPNNPGNRLAWRIYEYEMEIWEAIQTYGHDIPMTEPISPADVGVPELD